ncbi:hypothetical protein Bca4012_024274 [Brassica carinata]
MSTIAESEKALSRSAIKTYFSCSVRLLHQLLSFAITSPFCSLLRIRYIMSARSLWRSTVMLYVNVYRVAFSRLSMLSPSCNSAEIFMKAVQPALFKSLIDKIGFPSLCLPS